MRTLIEQEAEAQKKEALLREDRIKRIKSTVAEISERPLEEGFAKFIYLSIPDTPKRKEAISFGFTNLTAFIRTLGDDEGTAKRKPIRGMLMSKKGFIYKLFAYESQWGYACKVMRYLISEEGFLKTERDDRYSRGELLAFIPQECRSKCLEPYKGEPWKKSQVSGKQIPSLLLQARESAGIYGGGGDYCSNVSSLTGRESLISELYGHDSLKSLILELNPNGGARRVVYELLSTRSCDAEAEGVIRHLVEKGWTELLKYVPEDRLAACGGKEAERLKVESFITESEKTRGDENFIKSIHGLIQAHKAAPEILRGLGCKTVSEYIRGDYRNRKQNKKNPGLDLDDKGFALLAFTYKKHREVASEVISFLVGEGWSQLLQHVPDDFRGEVLSDFKLSRHGGGTQNKSDGDKTLSVKRGTGKDYIMLKLAREAEQNPKAAQLLQQVRDGATTAAKAAVEMGWRKPTITVSKDVSSAERALRKLFNQDEVEALGRALLAPK